jgi:hypothetical protein
VVAPLSRPLGQSLFERKFALPGTLMTSPALTGSALLGDTPYWRTHELRYEIFIPSSCFLPEPASFPQINDVRQSFAVRLPRPR